jgi:hypothetical protein
MNGAVTEYLKSLLPQNLPDGRQFVKEGMEMGNDLELGKSLFLEKSGYPTYLAYKKACSENNKIVWQILLGLATLDEELDAIKEIYDFSQRTGLQIDTVQAIPSQGICLPKEYREGAPSTTSYMINSYDEWIAHTKVVPMQIIFEDQHLSCPNSLETTIGPLLAGSPRIGIFSQFIWGYPGFNDDVKRYTDMLKSIGIVASKKDQDIMVDTYLDDGMPSYFLDCASYVGYALLEHYIVTTLCGARLSFSYGGLLSEGHTRMAVGMAIDKLLSTEEQPALSYINGSTVMQWDHDIEANYGPSVQEMLLEILVINKYKLCMSINPVSITEKVGVATLQDLLNITAAGIRTEEKVGDWERLMDFTVLENMRDVMAEKGKIFFNNVLQGFKEAGIDINDPLQLIMVLKRFNCSKFETLFHPSVSETGTFTPYYPTVLGQQTIDERNGIIEGLSEQGLKGSLDGKRIAICSGDGHSYGLLLVEGVLEAMGAKVSNGGVDVDPAVILDLADEEGINIIACSVHNGQALDYARQITKLAKERHKDYHIYMGGRLNAILPGNSEATDVTDLVRENGIFASNDLAEIVRTMKNIKQ